MQPPPLMGPSPTPTPRGSARLPNSPSEINFNSGLTNLTNCLTS